jgi:hypothetical protein
MEKKIRVNIVRKVRNVDLDSFIYLIDFIDGCTDETIKEVFRPLKGGKTFEKLKTMLSYIVGNSDGNNVEDCAKRSLRDWNRGVTFLSTHE